jgi:predicted PurR-regulated permease PerM
VTRLTNAIPVLPRVVATILVYAALFAVIVLIVIALAGALATSISEFIQSVPTLRQQRRSCSPRGRRRSTGSACRSTSWPRPTTS